MSTVCAEDRVGKGQSGCALCVQRTELERDSQDAWCRAHIRVAEWLIVRNSACNWNEAFCCKFIILPRPVWQPVCRQPQHWIRWHLYDKIQSNQRLILIFLCNKTIWNPCFWQFYMLDSRSADRGLQWERIDCQGIPPSSKDKLGVWVYKNKYVRSYRFGLLCRM